MLLWRALFSLPLERVSKAQKTILILLCILWRHPKASTISVSALEMHNICDIRWVIDRDTLKHNCLPTFNKLFKIMHIIIWLHFLVDTNTRAQISWEYNAKDDLMLLPISCSEASEQTEAVNYRDCNGAWKWNLSLGPVLSGYGMKDKYKYYGASQKLRTQDSWSITTPK